jgi:hypothetical protein
MKFSTYTIKNTKSIPNSISAHILNSLLFSTTNRKCKKSNLAKVMHLLIFFHLHFNIRLAREQSPGAVIKAETHSPRVEAATEVGGGVGARTRRHQNGTGFGTRQSLRRRPTTHSGILHTHTRKNRMEAKMETAAGRSAGRPTLALTRSRSLCAAADRRDERPTPLALARSAASCCLLDAAAQRARAPQHHQNSARRPRRRPSRIHHAGCIEFIRSWGCRHAHRRTLPFSSKRPRTPLGSAISNRDYVCCGRCDSPCCCKNMVEQPNELAPPLCYIQISIILQRG